MAGDQKNDNSIKKSLAVSLIGVIVIFLFRLLLIVLLPVPLTFFILRRGKIHWLIALTLLVGSVWLFINPQSNILWYVLVMSGYVSFILAELFERGFSSERIIFLGSVACIGLSIFFMANYTLKSGYRLDQVTREEVKQFIAQVITVYEQEGVDSEQIGWLKESSQQIEETMVRAFPAIGIIFIISVIFINYFFLRRWLESLEFPVEDKRPFQQWLLPDYLVWIFIIAGIIWYLKRPALSWLSLNFLLLISYLYLIQGIAIIIYFLRRGKIPLFFQYVGLIGIFLVPGSYILLTCGGLFDTWFDFRKLRVKIKTENEGPGLKII